MDTTALSYWLNWRFLLCATWVVLAGAGTTFLIWKYEWPRKRVISGSDNQQRTVGILYKDEAWKSCLKGIHRVWLLAYRLAAFTMLLLLLIANVYQRGVLIFIFYTQWTFTLVTLYFLLASILSIYGCFKSDKKDSCGRADQAAIDAEAGTYVNPTAEWTKDRKTPSDICRYLFQIVYQIAAGAVVLTDFVFWCILFPFFEGPELNYMDVCFHALNAIFLLGDTILNNMPFAFFRIAYFFLWTGLFVIVQWIVHACISIPWPYEFLNLASPYAPLWYLGVGLFHLPCYSVFALITKLKHVFLSRCFPNNYRHTI